MLLSPGFPPNIKELKKHFKINDNVIFTYGDTVYIQKLRGISPDLMVHETVHRLQQQKEGGPEIWWGKFLEDKDFRLLQELSAYRTQYKYICTQVKDRNKRAIILSRLASDLSSEIYGSIITWSEATNKIKQ